MDNDLDFDAREQCQIQLLQQIIKQFIETDMPMLSSYYSDNDSKIKRALSVCNKLTQRQCITIAKMYLDVASRFSKYSQEERESLKKKLYDKIDSITCVRTLSDVANALSI